MTSTTTPPIHELIASVYASKPDFLALAEQHSRETPALSSNDDPSDQKLHKQLERGNKPEHSKRLDRLVSGSNLPYRLKQQSKREQKQEKNMPVHPSEENATGDLTDQVAKESKDSTASDHPIHQEDTGATSGGSVGAAAAHKANLGPVMAENIGKPASREELQARSEELNKK